MPARGRQAKSRRPSPAPERPRPRTPRASAATPSATTPRASTQATVLRTPGGGSGTGPLEVPPAHELAAVFRRLDARGRGALSIGEVDRAVAELYGEQGSSYRPALQRSFHAADAAGGGALGLAEFCLFFEYLVYFRANWATFERIERACGDGLALESLIAACKQLGQPLQRAQALTAFQLMAGSSALAGRVTMDSFCRWSAQWHVERGAELAAELDVAPQSPTRPPEIEIDLDDTSVRTFGKNNAGQLGLGHWGTNQRAPDRPVRLPRIDPPPAVPRLVKKVACGGRHTVVLSTSGELWSFGANEHGQLGMGISQPKTTRAVGMHASTTSSYTTPQRVRGSTSMLRTGVRDIACGDSFSMLVDGDGAVWGWGDNRRGQLGHPTLSRQAHAREDGAMNQALMPTRLDGSAPGPSGGQLPAVHTLAAGHSHCVAITQEGGLWSWGWNEYGQLGLEHLDPFHYVPQQVRGALAGRICTAVGCGERHTVVAAFDATGDTDRGASLAYSFGNNSSGQLGIGKEKGHMGFVESVPTPQHVLFNPDLEFGLGMTRHARAPSTGSRARPGTRPRSPAAVRRREQESGQEKGAYLGGGDYGDGGPRPNMQRLADHPSELGLSVVRIACGARHTLAVVEHNGIVGSDRGGRQPGYLTVWSWGQNNKGQLGLALNEGVAASGGCGNMSIPHRVAAVDRMSSGDLSGAQVSCGHYTSYVALRGAVYAWGNNHAGQLGVNTETHDSIHLISKKQKDTDVAREIDLAEISHAAADTSGTSSHKLNKLMCVAAGGDHAAIWVDSSSSAVIADDSRGTAPRRFDDCSLPKKCEIAVMGHDPVLLADCIQQVVRDRSTATMEKPLQQRIDHLQDAWDPPATETDPTVGAHATADSSSCDETFLHSLEAAQAAAAAAVEAEVPKAVTRSRSTNAANAGGMYSSPSPARSRSGAVVSGSASGSTPGSASAQATRSFRARSPKPAPRSPARASPAQQRRQSTSRRQSKGGARASVSHAEASELMANPTAAVAALPSPSSSSSASSALPIQAQRLMALEGDVSVLKSDVAAMREEMIGLRGDVASMAQEIGRAIELMARKA